MLRVQRMNTTDETLLSAMLYTMQQTTAHDEPYAVAIDLLMKKMEKHKSDVKGSIENELQGLRYIINKHKQVFCSFLPKVVVKRKDFMIIWECKNKDERVLRIPKNFFTSIVACLAKENKRYGAILMSLRHRTCKRREGAHANVLIYDKETNTVERFDPNGGWRNKFSASELDRELARHFKLFNVEYKIPNDFCPAVSFQSLQGKERRFKHGLCAAWTLWYLDFRLSNPRISDPSVLVKHALDALKKEPSMTTFILDYISHVLASKK